jgi:hypothetical protein
MAKPRKPRKAAQSELSEPSVQTRLEKGFYKSFPVGSVIEWAIIIVGGVLFFTVFGFLFVSCAELTRFPK